MRPVYPVRAEFSEIDLKSTPKAQILQHFQEDASGFEYAPHLSVENHSARERERERENEWASEKERAREKMQVHAHTSTWRGREIGRGGRGCRRGWKWRGRRTHLGEGPLDGVGSVRAPANLDKDEGEGAQVCRAWGSKERLAAVQPDAAGAGESGSSTCTVSVVPYSDLLAQLPAPCFCPARDPSSTL